MQKCAADIIGPIRRRRVVGWGHNDGSWNYFFVKVIGIDGRTKETVHAFRKDEHRESCFENFDVTKDRLIIYDYSYTRNVSWTIAYLAYIFILERIFY